MEPVDVVTPEMVGICSTRLQRVSHVLDQYVERNQLAGLVTLLARDGQVVHLSTSGMLDREMGQPMRADAIFRIASMLKPITATAVMMLYEEGHFQLDDPVGAFIPAFADPQVAVGRAGDDLHLTESSRVLTIRHLLTHTSGMCLGANEDDPVEVLYTARVAELIQTPGMTLGRAVDELATLPLAHQPGSAWRYGLSYEVLARLVEVISGEWFDVFLQRRVFAPLGMVDSAYVVAPGSADRFTSLYQWSDPDGMEVAAAAAGSPQIEFFGYEPGTVWTSGGSEILSTAADYYRFAQMLLNNGTLDGEQILSRKTVALMAMNHLPDALMPFDHRRGYGQGLGLYPLLDVVQSGAMGTVGELMGSGGHGTYFWIDPHESLIGILMTQLSANPWPIHHQFKVLAYQALKD